MSELTAETWIGHLDAVRLGDEMRDDLALCRRDHDELPALDGRRLLHPCDDVSWDRNRFVSGSDGVPCRDGGEQVVVLHVGHGGPPDHLDAGEKRAVAF